MRKGAATREQILERAVQIATRDGLDGLTIGTLASEIGMSKSGLFAHFGSKEELQVQVLKTGVDRFDAFVVRPALAEPRGEPRVRALFDRWLAWGDAPDLPGGCLLIAAAVELDDKPGPPRDFLVSNQKLWYETLTRAARIAIEEGHFSPDTDPAQFAFEMKSIVHGYHDLKRLLEDPVAERRARTAFERLLASTRA